MGYLASSLGAGYLLGAAVGRHALARFGVRNVLGAAQLAIGGSFFALFNSPDLPVAVLAAALLGIPGEHSAGLCGDPRPPPRPGCSAASAHCATPWTPSPPSSAPCAAPPSSPASG
ncbi:hypothetical protein [Actinacidiphila oryziradicis]|uniref:hypothetical protein n=1 Tax=Actinacidiphila oryziradicis TaxID=2571141 RepID=UPI0023F0E48D|nr:hypothetical protein [Actinacidiphila oryziradicis]